MSGVRWVRRGHAPNCSATGIVVGTALLTVLSAALVVNVWADRFTRWRDTPGPKTDARLRKETFGSLLALPGAAALLALDGPATAQALQAGATTIGVEAGTLEEGVLSGPIEAHLAPSSRCALPCKTCYLGEGGTDDAAALDADIDALAAAGVFEVAVGGAEPTDPEALVALGKAIVRRGLVANLTTSGLWVTPVLAKALAGTFTQVNVSLDGLGADYKAVRGFAGADRALAAIGHLVAAGARVGVNTVLTRHNVGDLEAMGAQLAARGVSEWQWLRLKPVGRAAVNYEQTRLTTAQVLALWDRTCAIEGATGLVMRWDCAMVPFLATHGLPAAALAKLGVMGCPGGTSLVARRADGRFSPCSFYEEVSFSEEATAASLTEAWQAPNQWRAFRSLPTVEPCVSCPYLSVCRGGCRVIAPSADPQPDPECPRVVAAAS